ncbi:MAG: hypothetical protein IT435_17425 [Phycisphaerales bacterium]|nr:hypothetical protein [Phycisphaerales bacterium]
MRVILYCLILVSALGAISCAGGSTRFDDSALRQEVSAAMAEYQESFRATD